MKYKYLALKTITESTPSYSSEAEKYSHLLLEVFCFKDNNTRELIRIRAQKHKDRENQHWSKWYATSIEVPPIEVDYTYICEKNAAADFAKDLEKFRQKAYKIEASFESGMDAILGFLKSKKCEPRQCDAFYTRNDFFRSADLFQAWGTK